MIAQRLNEDYVRDRIRHAIADLGGKQKAFCVKHGFSQSLLSAVLIGKKPPTPAMCAIVGVRKLVIYEPVKENDDEQGRKRERADAAGAAEGSGEHPR